MRQDVSNRLGSNGDVDELFLTKWLFDINTDDLLEKKIKPEYIPKQAEEEFDIFGQEYKFRPQLSRLMTQDKN